MAQPLQKSTPPSTAAAPAPRADKAGWIVALLTLANLAALGGVAYFNKQMWERINHLGARVEDLARPELAAADSPVGKELQPRNFGIQFPLESFLVNLASTQGPKFLQVQMHLELSSPGVEEELIRKKAVVRDAVISLLTSRSYQELRKPEGMQTLRDDLKARINNLLATGKINRVFFTQFHFN